MWDDLVRRTHDPGPCVPVIADGMQAQRAQRIAAFLILTNGNRGLALPKPPRWLNGVRSKSSGSMLMTAQFISATPVVCASFPVRRQRLPLVGHRTGNERYCPPTARSAVRCL